MPALTVREVCPRDGWQNLGEVISTEKKISYIADMLDAGTEYMQVTAFVSPKAVPQMFDAAVIARAVLERFPGKRFCALVPNLRGAQNAWECGIREVSRVLSVSESHNKANIGQTCEESLNDLAVMRDKLPELTVVPALAAAFGCPFEGEQPFEKVMGFVDRLARMGFDRLEIADTIGTGNPVRVAKLFSTVKREYPGMILYAHMHDTRGGGILNSWTAAQNGADIVDTALGGLGGCPFAPGASGNTATEDFVWLLEQSGIHTGINFGKIRDLAKKMRSRLPGCYSGHHAAIEKDVYEAACAAQKEEEKHG